MGTDISGILSILSNKNNIEVMKEELYRPADRIADMPITELLLNRILTSYEQRRNCITASHVANVDKKDECVYSLELTIHEGKANEKGRVFLLESRIFKRYADKRIDSLIGTSLLVFNLVDGEYILDTENIYDDVWSELGIEEDLY